MSEEDQTVDVTALPKFDMPSYESKMTAKDVKSLALHHGIPLDLHPVALTEGWTVDKLPDDMIACAIRIEQIDYVRAILSEPKYRSFYRRAIPDAMAWRHHDSDINDLVPEDGFSMQDVKALTERVIDLRPVPSGLLFQGGLSTTWDYPGLRPIFKDTEGNVVTMFEYLRFPFLSDASILKGHALSSHDCIPQHTTCPLSEGQNIPEKTDHQRRVEVKDPKIVATQERKARVAAKKRRERNNVVSVGRVLGLKLNEGKPQVVGMDMLPLRPLPLRSPSGYSTLINLLETDDLNLGSSGEQSGRALTIVNTKVIQPSPGCQRTNQGPITDRVVTPLRTTTQGANVAEGELAESHVECGDLSGKLVQARLDLTHNSHLYTSMSDRHKALKNENEGCAGKLEGLENRNRELSQSNRDQVLRIKELEAALAQKDSALVYAERINAEQAQDKERLVYQVGRAEMENFDCIRKLLPTVVERLLQSHEYKRSLSEPFNLAIQAGWGKCLAKERSEEDLLELMGRMEEKISRGFRHSVSDLLKVYLDSPLREQVSPRKPSSEKAPSTSASLGS
uniref:Transposase (Putative), gypsy type n=1 Tax=Tanacetum cinerariifolium TaxID=118510 RepID=A0A699GWA0_TANCI|nr:hypothetical protein [Tanacetum cinerariifolium]